VSVIASQVDVAEPQKSARMAQSQAPCPAVCQQRKLKTFQKEAGAKAGQFPFRGHRFDKKPKPHQRAMGSSKANRKIEAPELLHGLDFEDQHCQTYMRLARFERKSEKHSIKIARKIEKW
jgi:hypothetical protein